MKKLIKSLRNKKVYKFVYSIVCAIVLFLILNTLTTIDQVIEEGDKEKVIYTYDAASLSNLLSGVFFFMFLSRLVYLLSKAYKNKAGKLKNLIYAILYFCAIPILIADPDKEMALKTVINMYLAGIVAGRMVPSALKFLDKNIKKKKKVALAIRLLIHYLIIDFIVTLNMEVPHEVYALMVYLCSGMIMIHYMAKIVIVTFSSIKLDILKKIIKKTFATEILSGFVVLIFAVASVLKNYEPGMKTMGDALWYCFALVTTIGFGDFSAVTPFGRVLSVILGIYGIVVVSLITSIIVNFYSETKDSGDDGDDEKDSDDGEGSEGDKDFVDVDEEAGTLENIIE